MKFLNCLVQKESTTMSEIFSVNFNRSINDKYGATATIGSTAKLANDEHGMALKCNYATTDQISYGDIASIDAIGTGEFSAVIAFNFKGFVNHGSSHNSLFGKSSNLTNTGFAM